MTATTTIVTIKAKAFAGDRVRDHRVMVETNGTVRVFDTVAGYYTNCHSLSAAAQRRARKLAGR